MRKQSSIAVLLAAVLALSGCAQNSSQTNSSNSETSTTSSTTTSNTEDSAPISNEPTAAVGTVEAQSLGLKGVSNARQLGGYLGFEGKRVKSNLLLRTGKLADNKDDDLKVLTEKYRVTTVLDFRTATEISAAPDPEIDGVENVQIKIISEDGGSSSLAAAMTAGQSDNPAAVLVNALEGGFDPDTMYTDFFESEVSQKGLKSAFDYTIRQDPDEAVLWHCTGGKDRAGSFSALLLTVLGVDRQTILDDFELTNKFIGSRIEYMKKAARELTDDEKIVDGVGLLTGVNREYMEKALSKLDTQYGSVENYITQVLGVTDEGIDTLRAKYLE